ncbi:alpha/beta fold hydrolase [Kaistia geumhonensis]|uniref:Alpha/beta superfamily hydrolase n=1 Tax=Kaistia geumhonensis TaxID=410839 RepID=A0ABU0M4R4_9HYPH|nr:alpha/beta fold hydrolase [Kaistia geumhonensis]MCX5478833.1 alpha/beta fold hydrolase [Kaistia geumhonensis]MDQ0515948.1 alpha/beta superfamily hydrolase [Kaistia geumhonensis]
MTIRIDIDDRSSGAAGSFLRPLALARVDAGLDPGRTAPTLARTAKFGEPVSLGNFGGLYHPGRAALAVLMLSPIGFEEMCLRSTWRSLATLFAEAGLPCLRFDYPGTGDALDPDQSPEGIEDWKDAVRRAAGWLRETAGADEIVLVGQGFGATLALTMAPEIEGVRAVVAMAAVENGRHYLRELAAWSRIVTDSIGIGPDPSDENGLGVAGLSLPAGRAAAIKAMRLDALAACPAADVLVVGRAGTDRDDIIADRLAALGARVARQPFEGYETLLTDPTQARPPMPTLERIATYVAALANARPAAALPAPEPQPLVGPHFEEIAGRFGPGRRLMGVFCRPAGIPDAPVLVFTNAGHDYHIGWARVTVMLARELAKAGYASLRFDMDGIGDSPAHPGSPGEVLYSDAHIADTIAAVDHAGQLSAGRVILVGRCSGGYAALQAAGRRERVADLVIVNTQRFIWDKDEDVATAVRYGHRSVGNFGATLLKRDTLLRLVRGQLNIGQAGRYILRSIATKASRRLAPFMGGLSKHARMHRDVHRRFRALEDRGTRVSMLFSADDAGLKEFRAYFGERGQRLGNYRLVTMELIEEADHNFTHLGARERLLSALRAAITPAKSRESAS